MTARYVDVGPLPHGTLLGGLAPIGRRWGGRVWRGRVIPERPCPRREFAVTRAYLDGAWHDVDVYYDGNGRVCARVTS